MPTMRASITTLLSTVALLALPAVAETNLPTKPAATRDGQPFSEPTAKNHPLRVFWGDAHLHTGFSFDAGLMGTKLTPEDAFRFARGDEVVSTTGVPAKLRHPLDFLVVTDHSNYLGLPFAIKAGDPALLADPYGKKLYDGIKDGGEGGFKLFADIANSLSTNK